MFVSLSIIINDAVTKKKFTTQTERRRRRRPRRRRQRGRRLRRRRLWRRRHRQRFLVQSVVIHAAVFHLSDFIHGHEKLQSAVYHFVINNFRSSQWFQILARTLSYYRNLLSPQSSALIKLLPWNSSLRSIVTTTTSFIFT